MVFSWYVASAILKVLHTDRKMILYSLFLRGEPVRIRIPRLWPLPLFPLLVNTLPYLASGGIGMTTSNFLPDGDEVVSLILAENRRFVDIHRVVLIIFPPCSLASRQLTHRRSAPPIAERRRRTFHRDHSQGILFPPLFLLVPNCIYKETAP